MAAMRARDAEAVAGAAARSRRLLLALIQRRRGASPGAGCRPVDGLARLIHGFHYFYFFIRLTEAVAGLSKDFYSSVCLPYFYPYLALINFYMHTHFINRIRS